MRSLTSLKLVVGLVAAALIGAACGGGGSPSAAITTEPPTPTVSPSPSEGPLSSAELALCQSLANVESMVGDVQSSLATGQGDVAQRLGDVRSQVSIVESELRNLGMGTAADTVHQLNDGLATLQIQIASGAPGVVATAQLLVGLLNKAMALLPVCPEMSPSVSPSG
jgi:hypothetical protein